MKKLLLLLTVLAPSLAFAQSGEQVKEELPAKNEIIAAIGPAINPSINFNFVHLSNVHFILGYMRNTDKMQFGVRLEAGSEFADYAYASPVFVLNKTFAVKRSYLYAGAAAGFYYFHNLEGRFNRNSIYSDYPGNKYGYTLGLQAGGAFYLSKHFSLNTEIAVRSSQAWFKDLGYEPPRIHFGGVSEGYYYEFTNHDFSVSFPVTVGIKYRF